MASRARLVRASNRRTPVSYRETTLWATPSMPPSSLCEIPSFFLTVRISIMVTTYAYTDIRVNRVIHQRIGESHMRDLSAAMNEIIAANVKLLRQRHAPNQTVRSEEHTSELQSLMRISYAVFCLKKKIKTHLYPTPTKTTFTSMHSHITYAHSHENTPTIL